MEKAAAVMEGNFSPQQIEHILRDAMPRYGVRYEEQTAHLWLTVLVRLRQESGIHEIDLLRCVAGMDGAMSFTAAAALCAANL